MQCNFNTSHYFVERDEHADVNGNGRVILTMGARGLADSFARVGSMSRVASDTGWLKLATLRILVIVVRYSATAVEIIAIFSWFVEKGVIFFQKFALLLR